MVEALSDSLQFMEILADSTASEISRVDFFTSHEGLHLPYEQAVTRQVPHREGWYNLGTHLPWLGMRTCELGGAHRFTQGAPLVVVANCDGDPAILVDVLAERRDRGPARRRVDPDTRPRTRTFERRDPCRRHQVVAAKQGPVTGNHRVKPAVAALVADPRPVAKLATRGRRAPGHGIGCDGDFAVTVKTAVPLGFVTEPHDTQQVARLAQRDRHRGLFGIRVEAEPVIELVAEILAMRQRSGEQHCASEYLAENIADAPTGSGMHG